MPTRGPIQVSKPQRPMKYKPCGEFFSTFSMRLEGQRPEVRIGCESATQLGLFGIGRIGICQQRPTSGVPVPADFRIERTFFIAFFFLRIHVLRHFLFRTFKMSKNLRKKFIYIFMNFPANLLSLKGPKS